MCVNSIILHNHTYTHFTDEETDRETARTWILRVISGYLVYILEWIIGPLAKISSRETERGLEGRNR